MARQRFRVVPAAVRGAELPPQGVSREAKSLWPIGAFSALRSNAERKCPNRLCRRGREAADLQATVPPWCPFAGETYESEPTIRKPFASVRPAGSSKNPKGRTGAEGLLFRQPVFVAQTLGKYRHVTAYLFIGDLRVNLGGENIGVP